MTQDLGCRCKIECRSRMFKLTSKSISSGKLGKLANNPNFRLPLKPGTPLRSSAGPVEGPAATFSEPFRFLRTGAVAIWLDSAFMMEVTEHVHHRVRDTAIYSLHVIRQAIEIRT